MTGTITESKIQELINNIILQISWADTRVNNLLQKQEVLESKYVNLLEKTNQQLDLWRTPWGVWFAALSALFAAGAIIGWVIIYWVSKDFKDKRQESIGKANKVISGMENNELERINNRDKQFNNLITKYEEKLEKTDYNGKKKIQEIIEELKTEREINKVSSLPDIVKPYAVLENNFWIWISKRSQDLQQITRSLLDEHSLGIFLNKKHQCPICHYEYEIEDNRSNYDKLIIWKKYKIKCPKCWAEEVYS